MRRALMAVFQYVRSRFLAFQARKRVDALTSAGAPQWLRRPLLYLIEEKLSQKEARVVQRVEKLRANLRRRRTEFFQIHRDARTDDPGFENNPVPAQLEKLPADLVAGFVSTSRYWGTFMYLCADAMRARTILELGSCAGISGSYLASSAGCELFITMDGSRDAAILAESNIRQVTMNYQVIHATFEDGLNQILPTLKNKIDFAYIDGDHEKESTIYYFKRLVPHLSNGAVILLDDITWSKDMWSAWETLCQFPGLSHAIHLGRVGLCIWDGNSPQPRQEDFSIYTYDWMDDRHRIPSSKYGDPKILQ